MRPLTAAAFLSSLGGLALVLACQTGNDDARDGGTGGNDGAGGKAATSGSNGGTAPVNRAWAEWPMPNTPRDVAAGAPTPLAYVDNGNGTVTDQVTGLMWQQAVAETNYTWAEAVTHCPTVKLGGHDDWRLPTRIELVSLVDDSPDAATRSIAPGFPGTPAGYFWTASRLARSPTDAWVVVFGGGTYTVLTSDTNYVRCVR